MTAYVPPYSPSLLDWQRQVSAAVNPLLLKSADTVSVKADAGAYGDGLSDDTAAIQGAHDRLPNGGTVWFPPGTYKISSALNITNQGIKFAGARNSTVIQQAANPSTILNVTGNFFTLDGMRLAYSAATPTVGATGIYCSGSYCHFEDFTVANGYIDMEFSTGVANKVRNFECLDYESIGVFIHDLNDIYIRDFILNCGTSTRGALGGFRIYNKAEAVDIGDGDVIEGVYSMTVDAASNTSGLRPAYNKFTNVYFDSSQNGDSIQNAAELDFVDCWFSNRPSSGIALNNTDGVRFTGGGAINNAQNGVSVLSGAVRTTFANFAARGNSTGTANTYDGINFADGTTDFMVRGCTLGGSLGFGSQRYGASVNTGASDRYIIADNLVSGNTTGGVLDNGTGTNKRVANNY